MGAGARTQLVAGRGIHNFSVIPAEANDLKMHSATVGNLGLNPLSQLFGTVKWVPPPSMQCRFSMDSEYLMRETCVTSCFVCPGPFFFFFLSAWSIGSTEFRLWVGILIGMVMGSCRTRPVLFVVLIASNQLMWTCQILRQDLKFT